MVSNNNAVRTKPTNSGNNKRNTNKKKPYRPYLYKYKKQNKEH